MREELIEKIELIESILPTVSPKVEIELMETLVELDIRLEEISSTM